MADAMDEDEDHGQSFKDDLLRLRKRGEFMGFVAKEWQAGKLRFPGNTDVWNMLEKLAGPADRDGNRKLTQVTSERTFFDVWRVPRTFSKVEAALLKLADFQIGAYESSAEKLSFYKWHANYSAQIFAPPKFTYTEMQTQITKGQLDVWNKMKALMGTARPLDALKMGDFMREVYYYWLKTQIEETDPSSPHHQFFVQLRQAIIDASPVGRKKVRRRGQKVLQGSLDRWLALQEVGNRFEALRLYGTYAPPGVLSVQSTRLGSLKTRPTLKYRM